MNGRKQPSKNIINKSRNINIRLKTNHPEPKGGDSRLQAVKPVFRTQYHRAIFTNPKISLPRKRALAILISPLLPSVVRLKRQPSRSDSCTKFGCSRRNNAQGMALLRRPFRRNKPREEQKSVTITPLIPFSSVSVHRGRAGHLPY